MRVLIVGEYEPRPEEIAAAGDGIGWVAACAEGLGG
jgi:hypothetical protein